MISNIDNNNEIKERIIRAASSANEPIKIVENGAVFNTLADALLAADTDGLSAFTLEISGDVTEPNSISIGPNDVKMVAIGGTQTITMLSGYIILLEDGGTLSLGDALSTDILKLENCTVRITNGTINTEDGIIINGGNFAIEMSTQNAKGTIKGGEFEGSVGAISLGSGSSIDEISGGVFSGGEKALYITDTNTLINKISGGSFYQTDINTSMHGHGILLQNNAHIQEISDGYFEAAKNSPLCMTRGARIDEISGGEFVAKRVGSITNNDRNSAVRVEGANSLTSIGTISGGHFQGTNFGLLVIENSAPAQVDRIIGGVFEGVVAVQNDADCSIVEILGGQIKGTQGMLNAGHIQTIGGDVTISGTSSYGVYNYSGGRIDQISGGTIFSLNNSAIANVGVIDLISDGTIMGANSAIFCDGLSHSGTINTITGGVFLGKTDAAIRLAYPLTLEPGLTGEKGVGRYWGANGIIFNNESLVNYPVDQGIAYQMSSETEPVAGIADEEFKYLLFRIPEFSVTIRRSYADNSGAGTYPQNDIVNIDAGDKKGCVFAGWTSEDRVVFDDEASAVTSFVMPDHDVTIVANWECSPESSIPLIISSIAVEELALSHIINTEGEKLQYVLGTLENGAVLDQPPTLKELLSVNESVKEMLNTISSSQMLLLAKMSAAFDAYLVLEKRSGG